MCIVYSEETTYVRTQQEKLLRTQIINDLLTNIFYNIIETEDRIAADERFEDLSSNDMRVLSAIGTDEPKSMKAVAEYLRVKKQTVNNSVKALITKGYAYKKTNPDDGRYTWIILTDKGEETVNCSRSMLRETVKGMTGDMTDTQTDILIQSLSQINSYLDAQSVEGIPSGNRKK